MGRTKGIKNEKSNTVSGTTPVTLTVPDGLYSDTIIKIKEKKSFKNIQDYIIHLMRLDIYND